MTETTERRGSCLCGAVRINATQARRSVGACHCSMCRTWGGGPLMAVACGADVEIEGEEHVTTFDSSEWAERGFCSKCGTHLYYRLKQSGETIVSAGLFDDQTIQVGLHLPSLCYTAFGTRFFDYDNDGWLDLLVLNGAVVEIEALVAVV